MLIFTFFLSIAITFGGIPQIVTASDLLPTPSLTIDNPEFWIRKIRDPRQVLLTPIEIQQMNEENLKKEDLFLCSVKDLKEDWTKEEILALLKEDWEGFGKHKGVRYGRAGSPHNESFWNELKYNWDQESIKKTNRMRFGLIVKRTDIRVFPTEEPSRSTPASYEFDLFQHSSVSPGSLVGIYYFSKDKLWTYVQTGFIRGWVRAMDLAIAKKRSEAVAYEELKDRLVITGNFARIYDGPHFQQPIVLAQMGSSFPIVERNIHSGANGKYHIVQIPSRESNGQLTFRKGYILGEEDVHHGFIPYHQENVSRQAFKMLHQPYGWGELSGGRDCSRFIMDIFNTFGILMPRNSKLQAKVGVSLGELEGKTIKQKQRILDTAAPMATLLRLPGHIMLYLGNENGKYYVIHNIWGIQRSGWFGPKLKKIGKVVVSDLSLGSPGPNGSLLHRVTEIQLIGREREAKPIY